LIEHGDQLVIAQVKRVETLYFSAEGSNPAKPGKLIKKATIIEMTWLTA
jgi:hypothetical protein